ncbi:MAG TPA: type II 3-dehydroquinate dehydratase [Candidatus Limnocylindria bacterium]|nr:type II 3-dehydroquinate dehydratase [Candidatus Limnocylindria bacterium]
MKVLVLHGPNLNLLGEREPSVYGTLTLAEIDARIAARGRELGVEVRSAQSNVEGVLVDAIQDARTWAAGIIVNAGGYSHTSVAIRDAVASIAIPVVSVHLTNPAAREEFRRTDILATATKGAVAGFGWRSYLIALDGLIGLLRPAE